MVYNLICYAWAGDITALNTGKPASCPARFPWTRCIRVFVFERSPIADRRIFTFSADLLSVNILSDLCFKNNDRGEGELALNPVIENSAFFNKALTSAHCRSSHFSSLEPRSAYLEPSYRRCCDTKAFNLKGGIEFGES
jgi:hypothetical protein